MSDGTTEDASTEASSLKPSSSPARACAVVKVRLWLVRHGESEANAGGVIAGQQDSVWFICACWWAPLIVPAVNFLTLDLLVNLP
jgi:hypothetical protein